jgi:hypothetical protein
MNTGVCQYMRCTFVVAVGDQSCTDDLRPMRFIVCDFLAGGDGIPEIDVHAVYLLLAAENTGRMMRTPAEGAHFGKYL